MLDQITAEQQTRLYTLILHEERYGVALQPAFGPYGDQETKPARLAVFGGFRKNQPICKWLQRLAKIGPVMPAPLDERRKLLELLAADGSLHICHF